MSVDLFGRRDHDPQITVKNQFDSDFLEALIKENKLLSDLPKEESLEVLKGAINIEYLVNETENTPLRMVRVIVSGLDSDQNLLVTKKLAEKLIKDSLAKRPKFVQVESKLKKIEIELQVLKTTLNMIIKSKPVEFRRNYWFLPKKIEETISESMRKTCLLYTSPSPRDRTRSRMPSSA